MDRRTFFQKPTYAIQYVAALGKGGRNIPLDKALSGSRSTGRPSKAPS